MPKSTRDSWNRFSLTVLKSNRSYWCLDFTFSAFRTVRQYKFLFFKPPYLWCLVFASPGYEYSCVCVCVCVHARTQSLLTLWLFAIPWTVTHQAFLSMRFSWQELLEWVAISYSRGASWSSDQTRVFCIAGRFFTNWATRKYSFTVDYGCKGLKLKAEKTVLRKTHS